MPSPGRPPQLPGRLLPHAGARWSSSFWRSGAAVPRRRPASPPAGEARREERLSDFALSPATCWAASCRSRRHRGGSGGIVPPLRYRASCPGGRPRRRRSGAGQAAAPPASPPPGPLRGRTRSSFPGRACGQIRRTMSSPWLRTAVPSRRVGPGTRQVPGAAMLSSPGPRGPRCGSPHGGFAVVLLSAG